MQRFSAFPPHELKLVYRILHAQLLDNLELMDTDFLQDLQRWLQYLAGQQGIDVSDHSQWDAWLGNQAVPCAQRIRERVVLTEVKV